MNILHLAFIALFGFGAVAVAAEPDAIATEARAALADGHFVTAVEQFDALLADAPGSGERAPLDTIALRLDRGEAWLALGDLTAARADLTAAEQALTLREEAPPALRLRSLLDLGRLHLAAQAFDDAERALRQLIDTGSSAFPALASEAAGELGSLHNLRGDRAAAAVDFDQALALARRAESPRLIAAAQLNRARWGDGAALAEAGTQLAKSPPGYATLQLKLRYGLRCGALGAQAEAFAALRATADAAELWPLLRAQALAGLAGLYLDARRAEEAERLLDEATAALGERPEPLVRMTLEWRRGQALLQRRQPAAALAAWRRAVIHLEAVRSDLPLTDAEGVSIFQTLLDPLYRGLADLLLQQAGAVEEPAQQQPLLREAQEMIERLRTAELQDYFKSFCAVSRRPLTDLPPGTALIYPILLPDRLELLLGLGDRLERQVVAVNGWTLEGTVRRVSHTLRPGGSGRLRPYATDAAEQLYGWLIAPVEARLREAGVTTLVYVPDGFLRTVPLGALWDGKSFVAERYAVAIVPGLTLLDSAPFVRGEARTLLAGLSEPGPVVEELPVWMAQPYLSRGGFARERGLAGEPGGPPLLTRELLRDPQVQAHLQESLALPGVRQEIAALAERLPGIRLEDGDMVLEAVARELQNPYRVVHIASHGMFSGDPEQSFLLTHDHLLTMRRLAELLQSEAFDREPVELLTLSACQTAEGDDRSPLGLTGVAIQSGARSALGSLWPVSDQATRQLLTRFYRHLLDPNLSKATALQQAQRELLAEPAYRHPFFWSAFVLVGNWL